MNPGLRVRGPERALELQSIFGGIPDVCLAELWRLFFEVTASYPKGPK